MLTYQNIFASFKKLFFRVTSMNESPQKPSVVTQRVTAGSSEKRLSASEASQNDKQKWGI